MNSINLDLTIEEIKLIYKAVTLYQYNNSEAETMAGLSQAFSDLSKVDDDDERL